MRVINRSIPLISLTFTGMEISGLPIVYSSTIVTLVVVVLSMFLGEIII